MAYEAEEDLRTVEEILDHPQEGDAIRNRIWIKRGIYIYYMKHDWYRENHNRWGTHDRALGIERDEQKKRDRSFWITVPLEEVKLDAHIAFHMLNPSV